MEPKGTTDKVQSTNVSTSSSEFIEGAFVAVYLDKYKNELPPMIGQITTVHKEGDVTLNWLHGCYSGTWKICKVQGKVWSERIPMSCIISRVELTKSMKLPSNIVALLKEQYATYV